MCWPLVNQISRPVGGTSSGPPDRWTSARRCASSTMLRTLTRQQRSSSSASTSASDECELRAWVATMTSSRPCSAITASITADGTAGSSKSSRRTGTGRSIEAPPQGISASCGGHPVATTVAPAVEQPGHDRGCDLSRPRYSGHQRDSAVQVAGELVHRGERTTRCHLRRSPRSRRRSALRPGGVIDDGDREPDIVSVAPSMLDQVLQPDDDQTVTP